MRAFIGIHITTTMKTRSEFRNVSVTRWRCLWRKWAWSVGVVDRRWAVEVRVFTHAHVSMITYHVDVYQSRAIGACLLTTSHQHGCLPLKGLHTRTGWAWWWVSGRFSSYWFVSVSSIVLFFCVCGLDWLADMSIEFCWKHRRCILRDVLWHCWLGVRKSIWPVKNLVMRFWHGHLFGTRGK